MPGDGMGRFLSNRCSGYGELVVIRNELHFLFFCMIMVIRGKTMELQFTYWQDGAFFVGFLDDYPDDSTQGVSLTELEEALIEIYKVKQEEKIHLAKIRKTGRIKLPA